VVADLDSPVVIDLTAEFRGETVVVLRTVHRKAALVLPNRAVLEFKGFQPTVIAVLDAGHVLVNHIDWMAVQHPGGFLATFRLVTAGEDIDLVGEVEHDAGDVSGALGVPHHVH
jgi:hypothetical protein